MILGSCLVCVIDTKAVLNHCKSSIKKTSGVLHGNNVYATRVLDFAMDAAIAEEEWELALKYGSRALETYKYAVDQTLCFIWPSIGYAVTKQDWPHA